MYGCGARLTGSRALVRESKLRSRSNRQTEDRHTKSDIAIAEIHHTRQKINANDADLSGSSFTNVNLSGAAFNNVKLTGASIDNACLSKMRIEGANLSDL